MDNITQTILNEILERLNRIESKLDKPIERQTEKKPIWKTNPNKPATEKQIYAIHKAGGEIWEGMTQGDIEEAFKQINTQRKKDILEVPDGEYLDTRNRSGEGNKQGKTPYNVDSPVEIKLTEQELKELDESGY